ncbi:MULTISPECIES: 1,4-dihydroxy-6-naphthoate synthase [Bacillaceae]|uniref:1,4-dihydroxy-6-naphtoate synthase n=1 Tax=Evansella alkalicola TaxID=745819 RepID=A0ABS6JNF2_9BACI|nr:MULTISPECIES: 1,4-dihydroxy-6-naphthoate synthase [Bacillaceae]MBU9720086.1 1,4-dihydroxy-6-naphthoate synthase [Bacillus alkalicola]
MNIVYSPCPNDTFIFHALTHGLIPNTPKFDVTYADIDITNGLAVKGDSPEIMKISYAALPYMHEDYRLLPCGGALGRGCGPLVLSNDYTKAEDLAGKTVAVPSERSTAYLLFRLWAAQQIPGGVGKIIVMPFHEIMPAVRDGKIDAGLVIHEARFTYQNFNLKLLTDLGDWWEQDTGSPIPLGAIIAKKSLNLGELTDWIRQSVNYAWDNPEASMDYVLEHAQEMSPEVAKSHIDLYVNEFSADLGNAGFAAVESLLGRAMQEGLVPQIDLEKISFRG